MNYSTLRNKKKMKRGKKLKVRFTKKNHKKSENLGSKIFENCSPVVKNKTPVKNSCLIPEILVKIKDEYNKSKPESQKIKDTDYNTIWHQLKKRLVFCKKEKCWLNQIKNTELKNQIDQYIFAPTQPPEWKENPTTWLSNFDILAVLKQYEEAYPEFEFIGPTPIDFDTHLPEQGGNSCVTQDLCNFSLKQQFERGKKKIGICFNLSPHTSGGSHWVSLFIDLDDKHIYYMDSNGIEPPKEITVFIDRVLKQGAKLTTPITFKITINKIEHQSGNTECGMYSLFFITTMLIGEVEIDNTRKIKNMRLNDKIKLFSSVKIPDSYVRQLRNKFFNQS